MKAEPCTGREAASRSPSYVTLWARQLTAIWTHSDKVRRSRMFYEGDRQMYLLSPWQINDTSPCCLIEHWHFYHLFTCLSSRFPLFSFVFIAILCAVSHFYSLSNSNGFFLRVFFRTFFPNWLFFRSHRTPLPFSISLLLSFAAFVLSSFWLAGRGTASCLRPLEDF